MPEPVPYLELDSAVYLRAAADYARALAGGLLLRQPLTEAHYAAVEYWPPLFPFLAGVATAALGDPLAGGRAVSLACGWLALFPMFWLGSRLFGPAAGLWAAALVGFHPFLAWYARVPRAESLFLVLQAASLALVLGAAARPGPRARAAGVAGGACLGLAYATRFDALLLLPATVLAAVALAAGLPPPERRRARGAALAALAGFLVAAAPYLGYLAWLNGGVPTVITPQKALYDTLEGVWSLRPGADLYGFASRFGPPGLVQVDPADPEVRELLRTRTPDLVRQGLASLPRSLDEASWNWVPLMLLPAGLALGRDPRSRALLWLLLPVPFYALLTSWDPNPRYYAFTALPLALLAGRGLLVPMEEPVPSRRALLALSAVAAPVLLGAGWLVPGPVHFDGRAPVEGCFVDLLPGAERLRSLVLLAGFGGAALLAGGGRQGMAGLAGAAAALALAGPPLLEALRSGSTAYRLWIPWMLLLLALLPAPAWLTLPRSLWGRGMTAWLGGWLAVLALQNALALGAWDLSLARPTHCPEVAAFLREHAVGARVLSFQQVDVLRSGARWVPLPFLQRPAEVMLRESPDFVLLTLPEGTLADPESGRGAVRDLEATGRVVLDLEVPAPGGGCPRWWRVYRVVPGHPG